MLTSESNYLDIDLEYLEKVIFKNCIEDEVYLNSIIDNLNYAQSEFFYVYLFLLF